MFCDYVFSPNDPISDLFYLRPNWVQIGFMNYIVGLNPKLDPFWGKPDPIWSVFGPWDPKSSKMWCKSYHWVAFPSVEVGTVTPPRLYFSAVNSRLHSSLLMSAERLLKINSLQLKCDKNVIKKTLNFWISCFWASDLLNYIKILCSFA